MTLDNFAAVGRRTLCIICLIIDGHINLVRGQYVGNSFMVTYLDHIIISLANEIHRRKLTDVCP